VFCGTLRESRRGDGIGCRSLRWTVAGLFDDLANAHRWPGRWTVPTARVCTTPMYCNIVKCRIEYIMFLLKNDEY